MPVVLHEVGTDAEAACEPVRDLHLEADQAGAVLWVLEDIRLPALHVAAPAQGPA